nr:tRNA adenosine(34) deaminase TadA [Enhydrobacter aerosaccus]
MSASEHDYYKSGFCDSDFCDTDYAFMQAALDVAAEGGQLGEVPVGAVIVHQGTIIAKGYNQPILSHDATAHAEIVAIRRACQYFDNYRLPADCELFVTLEPCTMCLGAIIHARVSRLVFAATEPKAGMIVSQQDFSKVAFYNHFLTVKQGVMAEQSRALLQDFFRHRREQKKQIRQQLRANQ